MSISESRRLSLPDLNRGQIARPRLIERLTGRFDRRATLIIAGPGFGKSTLLGQAIRENRLAPRGTDHFLSCTAADVDVAVLVRAIANAVGLEIPGTAAVTWLVSELGTLPLGTCLVLDDIHEIPRDSPGHSALVEIVENLPLQCSVMIGSRFDPELPISRWLAQGLVEIVTEANLAFTIDEAREVDGGLGSHRESDANSEMPYGGWPALVELTRVTGGTGGDRFLREVVLRGMADHDRYRIAVLDLIGGGDAELLGLCLGETIDADSFAVFDRFPMMQRSGGGGLRPHALWQPVLEGIVPEERRVLLLSTAAQTLLARGLHDDAMRLFARCEDWDGVASVIADACSSGCTQVDDETLDRWRSALPMGERDRPEAKLVAGIAARQHSTFSTATADLLGDAAASFRERGQVGAEVAALAELAFVAREQGDAMRILTVLGRMFELEASGVAQVRAFAHLARAVIADAQDDDAELLNHLGHIVDDELSSNWASRVEWLRGHAKVMLGQPESAVRHADRSVALADDNFLGGRYLVSYVDWWVGPDARTLANIPEIWNELEPSTFDQVYGGSITATMHAYAGNVDQARNSIGVASDAMHTDESDNGQPRSEYLGLVAFARCALAIAEGDEIAGAEALRNFFAEHPLSTPIGRRCARRWIALVWVLLPELRSELSAVTLGSAIRNVVAIAGWFSDLREGNFRAAPIERSTQLLRALPLRWAVEALARVGASDVDAATVWTEQLVALRGSQVRDALRAYAAAEGQSMAAGAKRLLASVPVSPSHPLTIGVLGPLELRRDVVLDAPELRRGRVRQLIVALAIGGPQQREVLVDRLWPDIDRSSAFQNLRQTINYAHKALEPERAAGDAPFVLRTQGDLLMLVGAPWVQLDFMQLRERYDDAARSRRAGVHSQELTQLETALALVRGEPLIDVAYEEWASGHIRSLTVAIASAAQRAAEIRFAMADHDRAQAHAALCVRFDPWCESAHSITTASLFAQGRVGAARESFHIWKGLRSDVGARNESGAMAMLERRLSVS